MTEVPGEDLSYCWHGRIVCLELMYKATISTFQAFATFGVKGIQY